MVINEFKIVSKSGRKAQIVYVSGGKSVTRHCKLEDGAYHWLEYQDVEDEETGAKVKTLVTHEEFKTS